MYSEALSHWYSLFKSGLDSHAPLKKRRVKREFIPESFNSEIQAAIAARNHLHRKAVTTNNVKNPKPRAHYSLSCALEMF